MKKPIAWGFYSSSLLNEEHIERINMLQQYLRKYQLGIQKQNKNNGLERNGTKKS